MKKPELNVVVGTVIFAVFPWHKPVSLATLSPKSNGRCSNCHALQTIPENSVSAECISCRKGIIVTFAEIRILDGAGE